jgi:hypothetical protein
MDTEGQMTDVTTNLAIRESPISLAYEKSSARNEQFLPNGSMDKTLRSTISFFAISISVPLSAHILHEASSSSLSVS